MRSNRPAVTSAVSVAAAFCSVVRSLNAISPIDGNTPPCFDAMHMRLNQAQPSAGPSRCSLGSSTASSYARHHLLNRVPPRPKQHERGETQI